MTVYIIHILYDRYDILSRFMYNLAKIRCKYVLCMHYIRHTVCLCSFKLFNTHINIRWIFTINKMKPATLEVIAFRTMFQVVLKKVNFNLPTAFLIMSCLDQLIPNHIVEKMFSLIETERGQITQTIQLMSCDPNRLAEHLSHMLNIRNHILFRRPILFQRTRYVSKLFNDCLKSVAGHILPHINVNTKTILRGLIHTIQLDFDSMRFQNDTYILNHRQMTKIIFGFPKNFDMTLTAPTLYRALRDARKRNIKPQPKFVDDEFHVKLSNRHVLLMSFTYKCPCCFNDIFDYNCLSQKFNNKTFDTREFMGRPMCQCISCIEDTYMPINFP